MTSATIDTSAPRTGNAEILIRELFDSALQPRRRFNEAKLQQLAASIRAKGVIEPLVVRPRIAGGYEIVAGHRRVRAAMLAGVESVPCVIRVLTDAQALEVMLIENGQREDVHPLDEADGYHQLRELDATCTPDVIAARIGVHVSHVYRRLRLRDLVAEVRDVFSRDEITAAHAERLARLTPDQQPRALAACFYDDLLNDAAADGRGRDLKAVAHLDTWIRQNTRIELSHPDTQHYFPEIAGANQTGADAPAATLLELSESDTPGWSLGENHRALPRGAWVEIPKGRKRCPKATRGVIVHGGMPRILIVCADAACARHFPPKPEAPPVEASSDSQPVRRSARDARMARSDAQRKAWQQQRPAVMQALAAHVRDVTPTVRLLELAVGREAVERVREFVPDLADAHIGQALALLCIAASSREDFARTARQFQFKLAAFERQQAASTRPDRSKRRGRKPAASEQPEVSA